MGKSLHRNVPKLTVATGCGTFLMIASSMASAEMPSTELDAAAPSASSSAPAAADAGTETQNRVAPPGPRLGGHIGTATPLVTLSKNSTTIADAFTLLHPIGISLKYDKVTVDFETVVVNPINPGGRTGLVIDPGVVYNFGPVAAGLRVAWQQADSNFGLIPLINKGIMDIGETTWFVEAAFPTFYADDGIAFNTVLHSGIGF